MPGSSDDSKRLTLLTCVATAVLFLTLVLGMPHRLDADTKSMPVPTATQGV